MSTSSLVFEFHKSTLRQALKQEALYKIGSIRVGTLQIVFNSDKDSWRLLNPKP